jgi:vacuolar-type H+-ATPase subunit E/Vma4
VAPAFGDLDALLAGIHRQTQQRAIASTTKAQQVASAVLAEAETQAAALREAARVRAGHEAAALEQRLLAQAELEANGVWLRAREELLERVYAQAEVELRARVAESGYARVLERLAVEAVATLSGDTITLHAAPAGHALLTSERLDAWARDGVRFERAESPADGWGGLIALCGRERFDASFGDRLAEGRTRLRERVFAELMGVSP